MRTQLKLKNLMMLLLVGAAFITNEAKSQSKSPIHFGLKGGANFSNLSLSKSNLDSKYSLGYHGGLLTRIDISKLYMQGEVLYSQKKSKIENSSLSAKQAKWSSIEVPVLVGYKFLQSDNLNFRIFGGGVYSYVLNDKASVLKQASQSFQKFDRSNVGYQAGVGVDVGKLTLDLRYEGALTNMSKEFKARPNSIQASIGFMIF
ncbi:porin family protein [Pedobacter foliorum]|uniref:porin family protein n=1 Tax=Pedobacter foliorum TaxID=2739058 RepID=UPI00156496C9|nr:porin family protein [Pedobacter foliorum]NRF37724.1 PorT family protein [Pedobacter foliorum]